jgi:Domain of unknown function (DUF4440)
MVSKKWGLAIDCELDDANPVMKPVMLRPFFGFYVRAHRTLPMRTAGLVCVLCWVTCLNAFPQQEPDSNTATVLRKLEHDWVEGQSRNDNNALDLMFDNALVYIEYGRLVTKGEYLSRIKAAHAGPAGIVMEAMTVRTFGATATVVGTYRDKGLNNGKAPPKRWRFIDTWVNRQGRWMLVSAAAAPLSKAMPAQP